MTQEDLEIANDLAQLEEFELSNDLTFLEELNDFQNSLDRLQKLEVWTENSFAAAWAEFEESLTEDALNVNGANVIVIGSMTDMAEG